MPPVTPADLALEFGLSQKRVRDVLRDLYGVLPAEVTRWELDEDQAEAARARLRGEPKPDVRDWGVEIGDTIRRRAIHIAYGGQRQGGISTPTSRPEIFVFTDPQSGSKYGYDQFEGLREDGSYSYTGEGQYGPQVFERGNRAIRDSAADGKIIRLFTTRGPLATYVGAFTTGVPTYRLETIPDADGEPRPGIIFNLVPVDADLNRLPAYGGEDAPRDAIVSDWLPPEYSDVVVFQTDQDLPDERVVSRIEFELQASFGAWAANQGESPQRLRLPIGPTGIEPDLYLAGRQWIVEAKKSIGRSYVRTAIGQVLDYAHVARRRGIDATPVVLLPGRPETELVSLMQELGIVLVYRSGETFEVVGLT